MNPIPSHQLPGIAELIDTGKFYFVKYNLDELAPPGQRLRYLFGVDGEAPALEPTFADFVEYAGAGWLSAKARRP